MRRMGPAGALVFLFLAAGPAAAQPSAVLSQTHWDFGEVWHPEKPVMTLVVRNEGNAELNIKDVRTTCGCTAASPNRRKVPPDGTAEIRVEFDTTGKQDEVTSKVIVFVDDPRRDRVEMTIRGVVKRAIRREPLGGLVIRMLADTVVNGVRVAKAGQVGRVRLDNQMDEPMRLSLKSSSLKELDVQLEEVTPGLTYNVGARTTQDLKIGTISGEVVVTTGLSRDAEYGIPVRVQVYGLVEPSPPAMLFLRNETEPPKPNPRRVSLHYYGADGTEGFKVTSAETSDPSVKVTVRPVRPADDWMKKMTPTITAIIDAEVMLPAPSQLPEKGVVITFHTNVPGFERVQILATTSKPAFEEKIYGKGGKPAGD